MSRRVKRLIVVLFICVFTAFATACGSAASDNNADNETSSSPKPVSDVDEKGEEASFLTFQDDTGRAVALSEKPERIVILSPEFLLLLYDLGGEAVGRMSTHSAPIPENAEAIQELGTVNQINAEQLTALNPDLVIGSPSFHAKLVDLMEGNDIPFALLQMRSFDDVKEKAALLGSIIGKEDEAEKKLHETESRMKEIEAIIPEDRAITNVVLNVSSSSVSIQRANTTVLEIGELLNLENIAKNMEPKPDSQTSVPYSIETLVEAQPDYVFITIHGAKETGTEKIKEELEGNPAWASLQAVKEGRVMVIPSEKFLTNPGLSYDESMMYLAQIVYPELFDNDEG